MFMVVGYLYLGWACTRKKVPVFGPEQDLVLIKNPESLEMSSSGFLFYLLTKETVGCVK